MLVDKTILVNHMLVLLFFIEEITYHLPYMLLIFSNIHDSWDYGAFMYHGGGAYGRNKETKNSLLKLCTWIILFHIVFISCIWKWT